MHNIAKPNILKVKPYVPGKPIEDVQRELGLKRVIKLASNENCLGPSPKAMAAVKKAAASIHRYPDASSFYLKKKIAARLGVSENMITLGNGSDEVIVTAIRTFVAEDEKVLIARPTFLIYEIASQIANTEMEFVPLTKDLKYDLPAIKRAITQKTKMIFIANPDNPTGTYVTKPELDAFLKDIPKDVIVFLDEAYFEFANFAFKDYPNGMDYLKMPNVIVSRSFSKVYGLAGLRIGYGVSSPEVIGYMERVRDPFNVNLLAQAGALAALEDDAFLNKTLRYVQREKELLYKAFDEMGLKYVKSATNFILVDVKKDCKVVFNELLKKGVIVRDMKAWGIDTSIRVTAGTSEENKMFLKALKDIL